MIRGVFGLAAVGADVRSGCHVASQKDYCVMILKECIEKALMIQVCNDNILSRHKDGLSKGYATQS